MGDNDFRRLLEARVEEETRQLDLFSGESRLVPAQDRYEEEIQALYDQWYQIRFRLGNLRKQEGLFDEILIPIAKGLEESRLQRVDQNELQTTKLVPYSVSSLELRGKERFAEVAQALERRVKEIRERIGQIVRTYISEVSFTIDVDMQISEKHEHSNCILFPNLDGMEKMALFYLMTGSVPILNLVPDYGDAYDIMNNHLRRSMPDLREVSDVRWGAEEYRPNEDKLIFNLSVLDGCFPDEFLGLYELKTIGIPVMSEPIENPRPGLHPKFYGNDASYHIFFKSRRISGYARPSSIREKASRLPYVLRGDSEIDCMLTRKEVVKLITHLGATFESRGLADRLKIKVSTH